MPNLCNGKKITSATGIGHCALYVVRLETYAFNITWRQESGGGGLRLRCACKFASFIMESTWVMVEAGVGARLPLPLLNRSRLLESLLRMSSSGHF